MTECGSTKSGSRAARTSPARSSRRAFRSWPQVSCGPAKFRDARFAAEARFSGTRFSSHADFTGATAGAFRFAGAHARTEVRAVRTWPAGVSLGEPQRPGHWAEVRGV